MLPGPSDPRNEDAFCVERLRMVERQLVARGIKDPRVLDAMRTVPRHKFVPPEERPEAYADRPLPIGEGQTISQPYMVALMAELLCLTPDDAVLEVGAGSGYQAAVLGTLVHSVVSIERHASLVERARRALACAGMGNVTVLCGDGALGCAEGGKFDAILVSAAAPEIPAPLLEALKPDGRLVCPVGARDQQQVVRVLRTREGYIREQSIPCRFVPLVSPAAWNEE